jgi:hypothetical protein
LREGRDHAEGDDRLQTPKSSDGARLTRPGNLAQRRITVTTLVIISTAVCSACGSSKPAYCGNLTKLEQSVKTVDVSRGLSSLKTQLAQIQTNAKSVISSAKSDFPNETTEISGSVAKLQADVRSLASSSPTPQQLATIGGDAKALVNAVSTFSSASKSKCG